MEFVVTDKAAESCWWEVGGSFWKWSVLSSSLPGCFQRRRCWRSRWLCHVLYYIVFEVVVNTWKNKIETEGNTSIYYAAGFACRFLLQFTICDC